MRDYGAVSVGFAVNLTAMFQPKNAPGAGLLLNRVLDGGIDLREFAGVKKTRRGR